MSFSSQGYYKLPLNTQKLVSNEALDKVNIQKSIINYINLLMTTHYGECIVNDSLGCIIWDIDFDNLTKTNKLREEMITSLTKSISENETRLKEVSVDLKVIQHEFTGRKKINRVKKRLDVRVSAKITQTNENFMCVEQFFIAPLSY